MGELIRVWTAEKIVDEKKEGEYITRRIHKIPVTDEVVALSMWFVEDMDFGDDWECDIDRGMYCDQDGDLRWIDVDKFTAAIKERLENDGKDLWEDDELAERYAELEKIKTLAGYTINCDLEREEGG
jgi:hypothetical protein